MKRNYSFDFLKFLFSIMIALYHIGISFPGASKADMFFFESLGYFLAKKAYTEHANRPTPR